MASGSAILVRWSDELPETDLDGLVSALAAGALLVDVRGADEFAQAHVPGAVLIPLHEILATASTSCRATGRCS